MPQVDAKEQTEILGRATCTVDEMSRVLGCGRSQAYDLVKTGQIRSVKLGRRLLVPTAAVQEYLTSITAGAA
jgi:excisionase family DNA binding protein